MRKEHVASAVDDHLKSEGTFEDMRAMPIKEVVVWQLTEAMEKPSLSRRGYLSWPKCAKRASVKCGASPAAALGMSDLSFNLPI